ncbi:MAG: presenilin family intramembrane aspartyl protease [Nanoarchaeota archaeon]
MKHTLNITLILLGIFLLTQYLGIAILYNYVDWAQTAETGITSFQALPVGERPQFAEQTSYLPVLLMVILGTAILLLLIRFKLDWLWKLWFLSAVFLTLTIAFYAFIALKVALFLALALSIWKIFRPNVWVQNFTELFTYGGLAAIFVPVFNLWSISILLILISGYDAYAVWKSKHMITLAQSQAKSNVFAGLLIPYAMGKVAPLLPKAPEKIKTITKTTTTNKTTSTTKNDSGKTRMALLGGGDIAFPLLFAGVVLKQWGLLPSLIIPLFALFGLGLLLWKAEDKKFYPAMPFISAGCFVGLGVAWLIGY